MPSTELYNGESMAKNTGNARSAIRWIRDSVKQQYPKGTNCEICGTPEDLEYHHYHTLSLMFEKYCRDEGLEVKTDEDILAVRDTFAKAYWSEVVTDGVTLCETHHRALHKIYGKQPSLSTADKQKHWVVRMNAKQNTVDVTERMDSQPSRFSQFADFIEPSNNRFTRHR